MMLQSDLMNSGKYKQIEKGSSGKIRKMHIEIENNLSMDIVYILAHYPLHQRS